MGRMGEISGMLDGIDKIDPATRAANLQAREAAGARNTNESIADDTAQEASVDAGVDVAKKARAEKYAKLLADIKENIKSKEGDLLKSTEELRRAEDASRTLSGSKALELIIAENRAKQKALPEEIAKLRADEENVLAEFAGEAGTDIAN